MVATLALDVLRGLEYMHSHSMLHRDVKVCPWSFAVQSHEEPPLAAQRGSLSLREICSLGMHPEWRSCNVMQRIQGSLFQQKCRGSVQGGALLWCAKLTYPVALCAGGECANQP
jgi:serine/threonine protein kinase